MHAVVTKATIHDINRGREFLNEKGIPALKQAPGFVAGNWVSLDDGTGRGMVIFESEEAATNLSERVPSLLSDAVTLENIEVREVVAHA